MVETGAVEEEGFFLEEVTVSGFGCIGTSSDVIVAVPVARSALIPSLCTAWR